MNSPISFVKGHCGWDIVTLLVGEQIPPGKELETALKIISPPVSGGIEVGFMYQTDEGEDIRLRIVDSTHKTWIPMCGGMSQVIGKAVVETFFRERFNLKTEGPIVTVQLRTDSSMVPLQIEVENGKATKVTTVMSEYAAYLYREGVEPVNVLGVEGIKVGYFLILDIEKLKQKYPDVEFAQLKPGPHQDVLRQIHEAYMKQQDIEEGLYNILYDMNAEGPGQARIFSRFYEKTPSAISIPWEFQCGTGTVAVGIAMAEQGKLPFKGEKGKVVFEWGSQKLTPDPYGIRTSELNIVLEEKQIVSASFSHSVIEILCEGQLTVPGY